MCVARPSCGGMQGRCQLAACWENGGAVAGAGSEGGKAVWLGGLCRLLDMPPSFSLRT